MKPFKIRKKAADWAEVKTLRSESIVEGGAGDVSTNEYFAVDDANAIGLPVAAAAATG